MIFDINTGGDDVTDEASWHGFRQAAYNLFVHCVADRRGETVGGAATGIGKFGRGSYSPACGDD